MVGVVVVVVLPLLPPPRPGRYEMLALERKKVPEKKRLPPPEQRA